MARLCERLSPRRRAINRLQVEARRRLSTRLLGEAGERSPCAAHWGALATCVSLPEASKQQQQQPSSLAPRAAARLTCPASPSLDSRPLLTLGVSKEEGKLLRRWFLGTPGGRHSGSCTVRSIKAKFFQRAILLLQFSILPFNEQFCCCDSPSCLSVPKSWLKL